MKPVINTQTCKRNKFTRSSDCTSERHFYFCSFPWEYNEGFLIKFELNFDNIKRGTHFFNTNFSSQLFVFIFSSSLELKGMFGCLCLQNLQRSYSQWKVIKCFWYKIFKFNWMFFLYVNDYFHVLQLK